MLISKRVVYLTLSQLEEDLETAGILRELYIWNIYSKTRLFSPFAFFRTIVAMGGSAIVETDLKKHVGCIWCCFSAYVGFPSVACTPRRNNFYLNGFIELLLAGFMVKLRLLKFEVFIMKNVHATRLHSLLGIRPIPEQIKSDIFEELRISW